MLRRWRVSKASSDTVTGRSRIRRLISDHRSHKLYPFMVRVVDILSEQQFRVGNIDPGTTISVCFMMANQDLIVEPRPSTRTGLPSTRRGADTHWHPYRVKPTQR